jgi:hypothetical protein
MFRFASTGFFVRQAREAGLAEESKPPPRQVCAMSYRPDETPADVERREPFVVGVRECTRSYRPVKRRFAFFCEP